MAFMDKITGTKGGPAGDGAMRSYEFSKTAKNIREAEDAAAFKYGRKPEAPPGTVLARKFIQVFAIFLIVANFGGVIFFLVTQIPLLSIWLEGFFGALGMMLIGLFAGIIGAISVVYYGTGERPDAPKLKNCYLCLVALFGIVSFGAMCMGILLTRGSYQFEPNYDSMRKTDDKKLCSFQTHYECTGWTTDCATLYTSVPATGEPAMAAALPAVAKTQQAPPLLAAANIGGGESVTCRSLGSQGGCTMCLQDPTCGWCQDLGDCAPGNSNGPNFGHCSAWSYDSCPASSSGGSSGSANPPGPSSGTPTPATATPTPATPSSGSLAPPSGPSSSSPHSSTPQPSSSGPHTSSSSSFAPPSGPSPSGPSSSGSTSSGGAPPTSQPSGGSNSATPQPSGGSNSGGTPSTPSGSLPPAASSSLPPFPSSGSTPQPSGSSGGVPSTPSSSFAPSSGNPPSSGAPSSSTPSGAPSSSFAPSSSGSVPSTPSSPSGSPSGPSSGKPNSGSSSSFAPGSSSSKSSASAPSGSSSSMPPAPSSSSGSGKSNGGSSGSVAPSSGGSNSNQPPASSGASSSLPSFSSSAGPSSGATPPTPAPPSHGGHKKAHPTAAPQTPVPPPLTWAPGARSATEKSFLAQGCGTGSASTCPALTEKAMRTPCVTGFGGGMKHGGLIVLFAALAMLTCSGLAILFNIRAKFNEMEWEEGGMPLNL